LRYRFGRLEFEHMIVRAAGYLRGELIADLDELGERLFVDHVAARVYSHMHDMVQAIKSADTPWWGATKAAAIQQFCADNDVALQHSYFYADGDEDAASMSVVGCPRPVNPRAGLAAEAALHGWPVICLTSGRHPGPVRRLRHLATHARRDNAANTTA
jgi:phosphoserine phosphatase